MLRGSYEINTDDLFKTWSKTKKPLFDHLGMAPGLERIVKEENEIKEIRAKTIDEFGKIDEAFMKELVKWADSGRKSRSKFIRVAYQGVAKTKGWITFRSTSQYTKGKFYYQYIKLLDIKDVQHLKDLAKKDIMRLLLAGNISCYCSCLKSDTKIKLLDGRTISVKDMEREFKEGRDLWVYSTDSNGDFKPGKVEKVWITGTTKKYIKVTLDNGKEIFTTEDHLYMLRNGEYCRADELLVNTSLMPLYFNYIDGYENVKTNSKNSYVSTYKMVANEVFPKEDFDEARGRSGENKISIHHMDYNKSNNDPNNFKLMGYREHIKWHADYINERRKNDPIFAEKCREASRRGAFKRNVNPTENMIKQREKYLEKGHEYWRTEEGRKIKSEGFRNSLKKFWSSMSPESRDTYISKHPNKTLEAREVLSQRMKNYWGGIDDNIRAIRGKRHGEILREGLKNKLDSMSIEELEAYNLEFCRRVKEGMVNKCKKTLNSMIERGIELIEENYMKFKSRTTPKVKTNFNSFEEMLSYFNISISNNHKVVKIEVINLEEEESVYDIKVDKWHNFYIDAGVILHNCPDFLYKGFKYMGYTKGYGMYKENRYPKIRNPKLEGTVCKHMLAVFSVFMQNWLSVSKDMQNSYYWKARYGEDEQK